MRQQLLAGREDDWERLVTRAFHLAMQGDLKWAEFFGQAIGKLGRLARMPVGTGVPSFDHN